MPSLINLVVITMPSDKAVLCPTVCTRQIKFFWCLKMGRQPDSETTTTVFIQNERRSKNCFPRNADKNMFPVHVLSNLANML